MNNSSNISLKGELSLFSYIATGLAAFISLIAGVLFLNSGNVEKNKPDIVWQQNKLEKTVPVGTTVSGDFGFITNKDLADVKIWVSPEIAPYIIIRPAQFDKIDAGSLVRIQTIFTLPSNLALGDYDGTVHVRLGNKTIAKPLPVIIHAIQKPAPPPAESFEIFYDDGTAEAFDFDPVLGRAVFSTKFYSGAEPIKIRSVKVFLKIPSPSPSPIDIYLWDFNRDLLLPPVRVTPTEIAPTEGEFYNVDLSSYNITVQNEFYFGIAWSVSDAPPLLGVDLSAPKGESFVVVLPDVFIPITDANLMIRAVVEKLSQ